MLSGQQNKPGNERCGRCCVAILLVVAAVPSKGESLATQIRFEENVFQPEGEWMEPKPIITLDEALDQVVKVHEDSVRFHRNLIVPGDLKPGTFTISGKIEFRACDNKICSLPREVDFQTQLRVSGDDDGL